MFKKILSARGMGQVLSVFAALIVMIIGLCADKSAVLLRNQYNEPSAPGGADIDNRRRSVVRPHNRRNRPLNRLGRGNVVHDKRDTDDKIQYEPDFNRAHNYYLLSCNWSCKPDLISVAKLPRS